jgi:hypothetical protein
MNEWSKQTQYEVNALKTKLAGFEKAIVVAVPPAPWCKKDNRTLDMRKKINNALKTLTRDNLNIKYLDIEQEDEDDDANWEDERHMTEKFTGYVMGKITEKMQEISGEPFFVKNVPWTSERKYNKVRSTYKLGCERCTQIGHSEEKCTGLPSDPLQFPLFFDLPVFVTVVAFGVVGSDGKPVQASSEWPICVQSSHPNL